MEAAELGPAASLALSELIDGARALGVSFSAPQLAQFEKYLATLLLWRARLSLTGAATAREIVRVHLLDSLAVARFGEAGYRVADLGSGAGFPGIPLAIVCPQATVVLVESKRKKANFLREVIRQVQLPNASVCEQRAESAGAGLLERCDVVISRAVWPLNEFLEIARALLRPGGRAVAMKGPAALRQNVAPNPEFSAPRTVAYRLHGGVQRFLLVYQKRAAVR
jgi:16S rRNA (guanine527-N7)-methyltransferase